MRLYRAYHTMISCSHLSSGITAIMKGIVALGCQLSDGPLGKVIVYREFSGYSHRFIPLGTIGQIASFPGWPLYFLRLVFSYRIYTERIIRAINNHRSLFVAQKHSF